MISHTNSGISIHIYLDAEHPEDYRTYLYDLFRAGSLRRLEGCLNALYDPRPFSRLLLSFMSRTTSASLLRAVIYVLWSLHDNSRHRRTS